MKRENVDLMCTGTIESGCAFAVCIEDGTQVFIPSAVSLAAGVCAGDTLTASIIPNIGHEDKTPWFAYHVKRTEVTSASSIGAEPAPEEPEEEDEPDPRLFTYELLTGGGVWTAAKVFDEYMGHDNADRHEDITAYTTIGNELRRMFTAGECSKWVLWRDAKQSRASKEWFSCYPERADVDEYGE